MYYWQHCKQKEKKVCVVSHSKFTFAIVKMSNSKHLRRLCCPYMSGLFLSQNINIFFRCIYVSHFEKVVFSSYCRI